MLAPAFLLLCTSCGGEDYLAAEKARVAAGSAAFDCVAVQAANSRRLDAQQAREIISHCERELEFYSRRNVEEGFGKTFDQSDAQMVEIYQTHRRVISEHLETALIEGGEIQYD